MLRFRTLIAVATVGIFAVAACGDDADETATTTTTSTTSTTEAEQTDEAVLAYCERAAELDEQEGPPTPEQLQGLSEAAPDEIKEDVDLVVEKFGEQGMNAFGDPEVTEALDRVEDWEADNCPGAGDDGEEEEAAPQTPDPDATQVAVTATDFEFAIEGEVPAEKVAFVMTNEGEAPHHMSILKFKEGTTVEQAEAAFEDGSLPALIEKEVGQSSDAAPGEEAVVNAELEPGLYGMGCFVEEPDGVPHFFKGMRTVFEVS
ncbi:MAG TPA: hypothetical protein VGR26_03805 [Acidimicrobiales bacterium]|nr:hypothetical protein [Acidimicrobiales bacterium]